MALLKKLLAAEPDNLRIQVRLADLYQAMGQNREAVDAYIAASQRALARGDQAECEKLADKAIKLDPKNLAAVILKARVHSTQGNFAQAAEVLEQVPDLEKGGEQAELLLDLYIKSLKWDQASALALKIFDADPKNFGPAQKLVEAELESAQTDRAMAILDRTRIPMIDAGEHEIVGKLLTDLAERTPGRLEPLEWLVELYGRTSDSFRLPDALAHLGDALVAENKLERAKQIFEQLVDREPESEPAKRKLNDVLRKMGLLAPEASGMSIPVEDHAPVELAMPPAPKVRPDFESATPEVKAKVVAQQPSQPQQPAVPVEPALDDETQKFIAQSLTDVDLFASYGLTQKAIGLLEAILRRAPRHTPTLEKLLDFVLGAGDDRRTAELAAKLETIYGERGDARGAERFAELRRRFQRAAGLTDEDLFGKPQVAAPVEAVAPVGATEDETEAAVVEALPELSAEPSVEAEAAAPSFEETLEESSIEIEEVNGMPADSAKLQPAVHEVDLSNEWESMLEEPAGEATASSTHGGQQESAPEFEVSAEPVADSGVEEFSIAGDEPVAAAPQAPAPVAPAHVDNAEEEFSIPVEEPVAEELEVPVAEAEPVQAAEEVAPHAEEISIPVDEHQPEAVEAVPVEPVAEAKAPVAKAGQPDSEFEVEQDYELVLEPEALVPAHDQRPPETPIVPREAETVAQDAASGLQSDQFLADLANEIDQLGIGELSPEFSAPSAPAAKHEAVPANTDDAAVGEPEVSQIEVGPLKEVFDEFRAELGEMGGEEEDLETHYNLGIAFREMGLLDEAISEFQKVAKAAENGRKFPYVMQCYTLLGLAFMDRAQPSIAAMWYERALRLPGVETESILALRYDLGVAQESAGESNAALKSFSQVYAVNIDYRDVGERIAALQKTTR